MSKKAALGFQYYSLDEEMRVPTDRELTHAVEVVETSQHERDKQRKLRWWHRNKDGLNLRRRAVVCSIEKRYKAAEARAIRRGWGWDFTQEEWERAWTEAPWVELPGSRGPSNPQGIAVPAFALRGSHAHKNTCMQRIDPNKPWSINNYKIMFRGEELRPGNRWYREAPKTPDEENE